MKSICVGRGGLLIAALVLSVLSLAGCQPPPPPNEVEQYVAAHCAPASVEKNAGILGCDLVTWKCPNGFERQTVDCK